MRLTSSVSLDDDASIDFNSTAFELNIYAFMEDYDLEIGSELAALIGGTDTVSAQMTGEYTEYQALDIDSSAGTASGTKVNPLRFEASIDLPKMG